jgi:hypothetical protein
LVRLVRIEISMDVGDLLVGANLLAQHRRSVGVEFDAVGRCGPEEAPRLVTPLTVFRQLATQPDSPSATGALPAYG